MRVWRAVSCRAHERVEAGGDLRMGIEIIPESTAENLVISRLARTYRRQQSSPCMRHATANAVEIQTQVDRILQQRLGGVVELELAAHRLFKETLAHQVP